MPTYFNNKHADQYGRDNDKKEVLIMETISSNTMIINDFVRSKSGMMPPCSEIKIRFSGVSYFKFKRSKKYHYVSGIRRRIKFSSSGLIQQGGQKNSKRKGNYL